MPADRYLTKKKRGQGFGKTAKLSGDGGWKFDNLHVALHNNEKKFTKIGPTVSPVKRERI